MRYRSDNLPPNTARITVLLFIVWSILVPYTVPDTVLYSVQYFLKCIYVSKILIESRFVSNKCVLKLFYQNQHVGNSFAVTRQLRFDSADIQLQIGTSTAQLHFVTFPKKKCTNAIILQSLFAQLHDGSRRNVLRLLLQ